jgi:RHS repeat-associated protein
MQHNGNHTADKYFYLHDRLGSVREVIDANGTVKNHYTYKPFGELLDSSETVSNPFLFTGQWFDPETGQYYLRARQYDPQLMRFTSRDPIRGQFTEPMTLHVYLYCLNDPLNHKDPSGRMPYWGALARTEDLTMGISIYYNVLDQSLKIQGDMLSNILAANIYREATFSSGFLKGFVDNLPFYRSWRAWNDLTDSGGRLSDLTPENCASCN